MIDGVLERVADLRRLAYRRGLLLRHRVAAPVISIGALSFGGVGKTPITAWIAAQLMARGFGRASFAPATRGRWGPRQRQFRRAEMVECWGMKRCC
jgi:tetraacyldisaccharide-1-P 4'-kinase